METRHTGRGFNTRRALLLFVCLVAVAAGVAGWNIYYWHTSQRDIQRRSDDLATFITATDAQIKQIQEEKAAKEAARKVAATGIAEQSAKGTLNAGTTDATLCAASSTHIDPASIDVIVNKQHCIQPLDYTPGALQTSNGATLSAQATAAYNKLFAAAAAAGQPFYVTSSYRSYADQVTTYAYWVATSGQDGADTYSARPGYSEHQTGLAFDVAAAGCTLDCFGSTSQYTWFQQHAADYGFIQRYYKGYEKVTGYQAEEWHYRYVGVTVAKDMQVKGIKTLEEYWGVTGGDY